MRLIDADALIRDIIKRFGCKPYIEVGNKAEYVHNIIDEQPTAYDPDKVVAELEERRSEYEIHSENAPDVASAVYRKGVMRGYEYSQDIVRKGDVHETD